MADVTAAMANIKHQLNDCKNVISIQSEVSLSVVIWWEVVDRHIINCITLHYSSVVEHDLNHDSYTSGLGLYTFYLIASKHELDID